MNLQIFFHQITFRKIDDIILNYFMANVHKMAGYNSVECNSHETRNIYPILSATPSNEHQFRLKKLMKLKIIFLLKLEKEN